MENLFLQPFILLQWKSESENYVRHATNFRMENQDRIYNLKARTGESIKRLEN